MKESTASLTRSRATPRATLAALGVTLRALDLFAPIRDRVQVPQKSVQYTPIEKLYDCFIGILAGAKGIADINRVLRADPALQAAFGRTACAEQSTLQDTLDACTPQTVAQMEAAWDELFRRHSQAARHDFARAYLLLDVDLTGNPCGKKAACATKGYFAGQKNRRGRQVGRVLASAYREIVVDRLFPGNTALTGALEIMVSAAEQTLSLTPEQRRRTIVRVDAGGGSVDAVNGLLARGYAVLCKDYSTRRARQLAQSVTRWYPDPKEEGREVGWVTEPATAYLRPVRRVAVRHRKPNGQFGIEVLITTVPMAELFAWTETSPSPIGEPQAELLAIVHGYDQRGGGCETSFRDDKQGLQMGKRNKKRFEGQQMLMALGALAHNVLVWAKEWLLPAVPRLAKYGVQRLVRDVMGVLGRVEWEEGQRVRRILLTEANPLARQLLPGLQQLVARIGVVVALGPP
jgi:Transposase DDE domain group 1